MFRVLTSSKGCFLERQTLFLCRENKKGVLVRTPVTTIFPCYWIVHGDLAPRRSYFFFFFFAAFFFVAIRVPPQRFSIAEALRGLRNPQASGLAGPTLKILRYARHVVNKKNEAKESGSPALQMFFEVRC